MFMSKVFNTAKATFRSFCSNTQHLWHGKYGMSLISHLSAEGLSQPSLYRAARHAGTHQGCRWPNRSIVCKDREKKDIKGHPGHSGNSLVNQINRKGNHKHLKARLIIY